METPGRTMGRKLRPQRQSTQGLRQNQTRQGGGNMDAMLQNVISQYTNAFSGAQQAGAQRIRDAAQRDLIARGINDSATGVDIATSALGDYTAQSNLGLAQNLLPLYQAIAAMAAQAQEAELNRGFQFDMFRKNAGLQKDMFGMNAGLQKDILGLQHGYNVDILGRNQGYDSQQAGINFERQRQLAQMGYDAQSRFANQQIDNQLDYQRRMLPIQEDAYKRAYLLEQQMNQSAGNANPYMAAVNSMAAGAALGKPLQIGSLDSGSKKWDPSQGPPRAGDDTSGWTYDPKNGTWSPTQPQAQNSNGVFDLDEADDFMNGNF